MERAAVRDYLVGRLKELGADTVRIFRYDSLVGPKNKHVEYTFDAYNVLADFPALHESADSAAALLLVEKKWYAPTAMPLFLALT